MPDVALDVGGNFGDPVCAELFLAFLVVPPVPKVPVREDGDFLAREPQVDRDLVDFGVLAVACVRPDAFGEREKGAFGVRIFGFDCAHHFAAFFGSEYVGQDFEL